MSMKILIKLPDDVLKKLRELAGKANTHRKPYIESIILKYVESKCKKST